MKKPWLIGGISGLIFAALIVLMAYTGLGEQIGGESFVQYVSSLPMFVAMKVCPAAPDAFLVTIFFLYWTVLGSLAGCILRKGTAWKILALLVIGCLAFAHFKTKAILEDQLASAARAFGNFFLEFESLRSSR